MKKTSGKKQQFKKMLASEIQFPQAAKIKSDDFKKIFAIEHAGKIAKIEVQIVNKKIIHYDDKNLKKVFKKQWMIGESILDAVLANYIGYPYLVSL